MSNSQINNCLYISNIINYLGIKQLPLLNIMKAACTYNWNVFFKSDCTFYS